MLFFYHNFYLKVYLLSTINLTLLITYYLGFVENAIDRDLFYVVCY